MKIQPNHYATMRDKIALVAGDAARRRDCIIHEGRAKDIEKRLRWDLLYAAGLSQWICDNLYSYANDDHIDTALRAIVRELEI